MPTNYSALRAKMSPEARAAGEAETRRLIEEMSLNSPKPRLPRNWRLARESSNAAPTYVTRWPAT